MASAFFVLHHPPNASTGAATSWKERRAWVAGRPRLLVPPPTRSVRVAAGVDPLVSRPNRDDDVCRVLRPCLSWELPGAGGGGRDGLLPGSRAPLGLPPQDTIQTLLALDEAIAIKADQLTEAEAKYNANADVLLAGDVLDWRMEIRIRRDKSMALSLEKKQASPSEAGATATGGV